MQERRRPGRRSRHLSCSPRSASRGSKLALSRSAQLRSYGTLRRRSRGMRASSGPGTQKLCKNEDFSFPIS